MNRDFVGTGYNGPARYDVQVEENGKRYSFTQRVGGADTDFEWDGAGPGSNDLARALLWVTTGVEPDWRMYRLFKSEIVSMWPRKVGECWRISEGEIAEWLAGVERDVVSTEDARQTEARRLQTRARESRVNGFAHTLKGWR